MVGRILVTRRSRVLLSAGLLVMTGLLANGHPAVAQTVMCPPTSNPGQRLSVTAQEVDSGTKSLREFTLAARQKARESNPIHFGCIMRQEGGPLRSSSTYIVQLAPDGRVHSHGKEMGLSGRKLKP